ncbi:alpha/beta hydrolase [[Clostridium] dakarense]|uniref:alpha/beta hydrolase n=1 Tax=Faecalimicrobium dakarense TaxID=1301100 RepID=UPI0004B8A8F9|nr:alpha/beta hydrolase [[Clostridium] dakarense]
MGDDVESREKKLYETFSITMELERPILHDEVEEENKTREKNNKKILNHKNIKNVMRWILAGLVIAIVGFFIWANNSYKPQAMAHSALISDENVIVNKDKFITFTPANTNPTKGFIFYPGARVNPESYAPICKDIAQKGYKVFIVEPTLNLAILSPNKAKDVIEENSDISTWVVGGHSLGGTIAAKFASNNRTLVDGVVLLASYPMNDDLKSLSMDVISIWGSKDGVVNFKSLIESKEKLPSDATFVEIEGGNHAQFGDYGKQKGDNEAIINQEKQIDITSKSIIKFLDKIEQ